MSEEAIGEARVQCKEVLQQWIERVRETTPNGDTMSDGDLRNIVFQEMFQLLGGNTEAKGSVANGTEPRAHDIMQQTPVRSESKPVRAYIDGCFDIMHSGHYNAIRQAKALADVLVVGVHSDAEILRCKGPPVMNEEERLATVKACKWVDEVVFDTPYDPSIELLDKLNCDFSVHGDDTSSTPDGDDAYSKVRNAGRLRVIKRTEGVSTTNLVGRLLLMTKRHHLPGTSGTGAGGSNPTSPGLNAMVGDMLKLSPAPLSPGIMSTSPAIMSTTSALKHATDDLVKRDSLSKSESAASFSDARDSIPQLKAPPPGVQDSSVSAFLPTAFRISQFSSGRVPEPSDKVVYIDGAFDLFHIGHIDTLKKARQLGTFLYVGLHDDQTVNEHKGKNYPIMNLHERVLNVLSCKYVDEVVMGAPWVVSEDLIKSLNIQVVASGTDTKLTSASSDAPDPYAVPKSIGKFQWVETSRNLNTDMVVQRIIDNRRKYVMRNKQRSKKEENYYKNTKEYVQEI